MRGKLLLFPLFAFSIFLVIEHLGIGNTHSYDNNMVQTNENLYYFKTL